MSVNQILQPSNPDSVDINIAWGMSIAEFLEPDFQGRRIVKNLSEARRVQNRHGIQDIYARNTRNLRYR